MPVYAGIPLGTNISGFAGAIEAAFSAVRSMERGSSAPSILVTGALWEKTDYAWAAGAGSAVMRYNGSSHVLLLDPRSPQINAGGTVAMAAALNMGGQKIVNAADGVDDQDLATVGQVEALAGGTWAASRDAGGFLLLNMGSPFNATLNPTGSDDVAARVDDLYRTADGIGRHIDAIAINTGGSGELNQCAGGKPQTPIAGGGSTAPTFCPRSLTLTLSGDVTLQSGGLPLFTLARTVMTVTRLNGDSGWVLAGTIGSGGSTVAVEVEWVTSEPRGFRLRLRRTSTSALCTIDTVAGFASFAVGMA